MRSKKDILKAYVETQSKADNGNTLQSLQAAGILEALLDIRGLLNEMVDLKDEEMQRLYDMDMDTGEDEDFEDEIDDDFDELEWEEITLASGLGVMCRHTEEYTGD